MKPPSDLTTPRKLICPISRHFLPVEQPEPVGCCTTGLKNGSRFPLIAHFFSSGFGAFGASTLLLPLAGFSSAAIFVVAGTTAFAVTGTPGFAADTATGFGAAATGTAAGIATTGFAATVCSFGVDAAAFTGTGAGALFATGTTAGSITTGLAVAVCTFGAGAAAFAGTGAGALFATVCVCSVKINVFPGPGVIS